MRILVVQESDWLRRNPHQQHHMIERMSVQGHEVLVIDYPIRWRDEGRGLLAPRRIHRGVAKVVPGADVTVIRTATVRIGGLGKLAWLATNALELARVFCAFRPDVVVILGLSNGIVAARMAGLAGIPVVVHLIDALHTLAEPAALRPIAARVERAVLRRADHVVVIDKALGAYAEDMGVRSERIEWIPTGADTTRFGPHVDGAAMRAEYGIAPRDTVLLFAGWLYTFSGLRELAVAMAADPCGSEGLRLLIVGDGDLMPELQRLRDESLGQRLILTGQQPAARMPDFMAAADICLLPAHVNDTMTHIVPAKIYEYLAAGKPILASPLPGLKTEFGDGAGIRYVDGPEAVLAEAAALRADAASLAAVGGQARRTAEQNGTWDEVTAKYAAALARAIKTTTPAPELASWMETQMQDDKASEPRVYVGPTQPSLVEAVKRGLDYIEWDAIISHDTRVAIKPNFCWPERLPGVTTSPEMLDAVLGIVSTRTSTIMVVESDGGTFTAEQAFAAHDAEAICARYGARLVNLSRHPRERRRVHVAGTEIEIEFSSFLLNEVDVLITLPVLKTHVVTTVSLGMKNLWGCIPTSMRLLFHPILGHGIVAQNMLLRPAITIIDATFGLDRRGPVHGDAVPVGKVIVSNNFVVADATGTRMLGFDPASVEHLRLAAAMELGPLTVDPSNYAGLDDVPVRQFTIKPTAMDRAAIVTYRHFWLSKLVYDSALTRVIYTVFRRTPPSPHVRALE